MDDKTRADALAFLKRHTTGVLATAGHDNLPHASVVHYVCDDDFNIYFLTLSNSRKFAALSAHPQVAFAVGTEEVPQTLQIEGMAKDISLDTEAAHKKAELFRVLNANDFFYAPISKLDPAPSVVVWIRPTWIRWADYAFAKENSGHVFKEIPVQH